MRHFSLEQAEALIPQLERLFTVASDIRSKIEAKLEALQALEAQPGADPARVAIERSQLQFLSNSFEEALKGVEQAGAVLKGLDPVLVDFLFALGETDVYLCWKFGEKKIRHYHGLHEGFVARKPLPKSLLAH